MANANDTMRELAAEQNVPLIDLERQLEGREALHPDPIHLNEEGVAIKAEAVAELIADMITSRDEGKSAPARDSVNPTESTPTKESLP